MLSRNLSVIDAGYGDGQRVCRGELYLHREVNRLVKNKKRVLCNTFYDRYAEHSSYCELSPKDSSESIAEEESVTAVVDIHRDGTLAVHLLSQ